MKITIVVGGRFHAFDLARELHSRGCLHRIITSYPKWKVNEWGIPRDLIRSVILPELARRGFARLPPKLRPPSTSIADWFAQSFDTLAARHLPADSDIVVGWSGMFLTCLQVAKKNGARTVVERGSAHILTQRNILREEYQQFNLSVEPVSEWSVRRELAEYREADFISVPSSFALDSFITNGVPKEKLIKTAYGVDKESFCPGTKPDNVFRLLHCGAISFQKGIQYLVEAFAELRLPNSELWLVGSLQREMRDYLRQHAPANVFIKGPYPQHDLPKVYAMASVFCLASVQEGMAMVIAQAMACGLPVICTRNTGAADFVTDGVEGYLVPARDVATLKARIRHLYDNPELSLRMSTAGLQKAQQQLSWDRYGTEMLTHYCRLLGPA